MKRLVLLAASVAVLGLLAACATTVTGSIAIAVTGLPSNVSAHILVTGPSGFSKSVSDDTTLTDLQPGTYAVVASTVMGAESVVPYLYDPAMASTDATVSAGSTVPVTVTYGVSAGSGHLWQPHDGNPVMGGFDRSLLLASGSPPPTVSIAGPGSFYEAVVFDAEGNAWVSSAFEGTNALSKYAANDLAATGSPAPAVTITSDGAAVPSLAAPIGLAFDANGNLWVAAFSSNRLEMFTPAQLASTGNPTPATVITSPSLSVPIGIAFDASGSLWVSNAISFDVIKFGTAQLQAGGSQTPEVVISPDGAGSLDRPNGIAFDENGDLWVANFFNETVVRFSSSQLVVSGTPTPAASIQAATFTSRYPTAVALDHDGNLWVKHAGTGRTLSKIEDPGALMGSVTPPVAVEIATGLSNDLGVPAFYPTPPDLPIVAP